MRRSGWGGPVTQQSSQLGGAAGSRVLYSLYRLQTWPLRRSPTARTPGLQGPGTRAGIPPKLPPQAARTCACFTNGIAMATPPMGGHIKGTVSGAHGGDTPAPRRHEAMQPMAHAAPQLPQPRLPTCSRPRSSSSRACPHPASRARAIQSFTRRSVRQAKPGSSQGPPRSLAKGR